MNNLLNNLNIDQGFTGRLIEQYLGIMSNNYPQQDFYSIGLKLKTIPIDKYR